MPFLAQKLKYEVPFAIASGDTDFPSVLSAEITARDRYHDPAHLFKKCAEWPGASIALCFSS